jgi:hypothetical protein
MSTRCEAGQQVELGRYQTPSETRVLVGRRIDGIVHVYDFALGDPGRAYFVEAGFTSKAELAALVADYLHNARTLGASPIFIGHRPGDRRPPTAADHHAHRDHARRQPVRAALSGPRRPSPRRSPLEHRRRPRRRPRSGRR